MVGTSSYKSIGTKNLSQYLFMKKINIITDSDIAVNSEELKASPNVKDLIKKAKASISSVEIDSAILQDSLSETYGNLMDVITETINRHNTKPSEIKFTLSIQSGGEVSVVSLVNANQKSITGIEFTIKL